MSFIKELPYNLTYNLKAKNIVEFMVDLGKKLNVKVCAECVEKKEQLEFFKNIGCDYVQGFLFSKPLPPENIKKKYLT